MTKIYGIPGVLSVSELFYFNNGRGSLRVNFEGGIPDDKNNLPATYTTDNEFVQKVIEDSPRFGLTVFRYNAKGKIIDVAELNREIEATKNAMKAGKAAAPKKSSPINAKVYEEVETLGQATEVLMELGCPPAELNGPDAVLTAMAVYRASFPNLKLK